MRRLLIVIVLVLIPHLVSARTWYVTSDGLADAPSIQAGVDSDSAGDTVLVACGTYFESNIMIKSGIVILSETGQAECAVIDAQWINSVLSCHGCNSATIIKGFTLTHGHAPLPPPGWGGGVVSTDGSEQFINCVFTDNVASQGAGAFCQGGDPTFTDCLFSNNDGGEGGALLLDGVVATVSGCTFTGNSSSLGGTVWCSNGSPRIMHCTFYDNPAEDGGAQIYCYFEGSPAIENTIIAYSSFGEAVHCEDETNSPTLTCCDLYGNAEGDWVGCISDQLGVNGNFSACPSFCDAGEGDLHLCDESPCLPGNHPAGYDCGLLGAWGEGCSCGPSRVETTTWGVIKSLYRQ